MYFRSDPLELFKKYSHPSKAVYCVKHNYKPMEGIKMYGTKQVRYPRKNWSSFILYNCSHKAHFNLTIDDVNTKTGTWLHNFLWLKNKEIGSLPVTWNWLEGYSSNKVKPKNVHFTRGGPWFGSDLKFHVRKKEKKYFKEWVNLNKEVNNKKSSL